MTLAPGGKDRSKMIHRFPGTDLGHVIMGLHWAQVVKGGYVKGPRQHPLAELGLDVFGDVVGVRWVLLMVGECGCWRAWCGVVGREAELDMVHERHGGVVCPSDAPLAHIEGGWEGHTGLQKVGQACVSRGRVRLSVSWVVGPAPPARGRPYGLDGAFILLGCGAAHGGSREGLLGHLVQHVCDWLEEAWVFAGVIRLPPLLAAGQHGMGRRRSEAGDELVVRCDRDSRRAWLVAIRLGGAGGAPRPL